MTQSSDHSWECASEAMAVQLQTDACQKLLAELPKEQRDILLAPYLKPSVPIPNTSLDKSSASHVPRSLIKNSSQRVRDAAKSGSSSRKRRQTDHADDIDPEFQDDPYSSLQNSSQTKRDKSYKTLPVFVQNSLSVEIKQNPKKLNEVLNELKPGVKISNIFVCRSGDIKLTPSSPHVENILRQPWPQDKFGAIKPRLPKENTANQEVVISNIPTCITKDEIRENLKAKMIDPKDIFRFNKKGSNEPSVNVKISLSSKNDKEQLLKEGFFIYNQHFRIIESKPLPVITQCFKCQKFNHSFFQCKAEKSTCLRCSDSHRLSECTIAKENAKCINCKGNHVASYKGCPIYKQEVAKKQELDKKAAEDKKSFAKVVNSSQKNISQTKDDHLHIIACLAESLSELVAHFKQSLETAKAPDEMRPFSIVSKAALRHLHIDVSPHDLIAKTLCLTPVISQEKNSFIGLSNPPGDPHSSSGQNHSNSI